MKITKREIVECLKIVSYSDDEFFQNCKKNSLVIEDVKGFRNAFIKSYIEILTNNIENIAAWIISEGG